MRLRSFWPVGTGIVVLRLFLVSVCIVGVLNNSLFLHAVRSLEFLEHTLPVIKFKQDALKKSSGS